MIDYLKLPKHLSVSRGWLQPRKNGTIGPQEQFSPSQIKKFAEGCPRAWGLSYVAGIKEEQGEASRNGDILHKLLHNYYDGKALPLLPDWQFVRLEEIPKDQKSLVEWIASRAFPGLLHLPRFDQVSEMHRESTEWIDTRILSPELEPLYIQVKKDLTFRIDQQWFIYDHKSTKDFKYALSLFGEQHAARRIQDFLGDIQFVCYAIDTAQRHNALNILARWVYYLMDPTKPPEARPLDAGVQASQLIEPGRRIFQVADEMRRIIRLKVHPLDLPHRPDLCWEFYSPKKDVGGCPYRPAVGGPCNYNSDYVCRYGKKEKNIMNNPAFPPFPGPPSGAPMALPQPGFQPTPAPGVSSAPAGAAPLPPGWGYDATGRPVQMAAVAQAPAVVLPPAPFLPPESAQYQQQPQQPAPAQQSLPMPAPAPVAAPAASAEPEKKKRGRKSNAEKAAELAAQTVPAQQPVAQPPQNIVQTLAPVSAGLLANTEPAVYVKVLKGAVSFEVPITNLEHARGIAAFAEAELKKSVA